uniref:Uncharacterized protein n=1 Tax=Aegilops tauschii subsp. strangulata TaxID=200361 RepID=A0A453MT56_AEGTS
TGQGEMKWILMMMWKFMPRKIRNERRIKKRSIKGATMTPQILKGMRRMNRGNLEGIAVIARNLGSTPMLQTQIVKTGIEDTKRIEIVPAKMVGTRSLKTVNLEKMGRSIRLCFYLQDLSVLTTVPCHVLNCCYFVLFCLITD